MTRYWRLLLILLVGLPLAAPAPLAAAPRCFPEAPGVSACIDGRIRSFWERNGGLAVFGYPLEAASERPAERGPITAQLFERGRLEVHHAVAPPYDVQLGRLGADALAGRGDPPPPADQPRQGCLFFAETRQNICAPFLGTWRRYGLDLGQPGVTQAESLALFGLPLGPARVERLPDGGSASVQWFERARFEDHGARGVLLGLLGRELGAQATTAGAPAPAQPTDRGGFIQASGEQLTRLGQPVQLKGVNYYPQWRPWTDMWQYWDGAQAERELRLARDQLGINTIRILLPYDTSETGGHGGQIAPETLRSLRELLQVAGDLDMRVIIALFDFYEDFPAPGSAEEERNIAYLETLLGNFIGDDRIVAWDIHNEPDHYKAWKDGEPGRVLLWMGRMADAIHRIAPNQLVTVGMGQYKNFWAAGPDGRRPIDYIDFLSLHNYNAPDTARQIAELRARTPKPIVLGEFGWPTGPVCAVNGYTEQQQAAVYREALGQATGKVAGVVAWTLRDFDPQLSTRWDTREEHYGLYRPDGSLKPAAESLRAYQAGPLPSIVSTDLPLSSVEPRGVGGGNGPLLIPATGHYVKGALRRAWELLGGQSSFGAPLHEAFVREGPRGPVVVQYFDAAVIEFPLGLNLDPGSDPQYQIDILRRGLRLVPVGEIYAGEAANGERAQYFAPGGHEVGGPFRSFYRVYRGQWRLGAAISEPYTDTVNGAATTVQYFQFGRLEVNPVNGNVEVGRLGRRAFEDLCQANGQ